MHKYYIYIKYNELEGYDDYILADSIEEAKRIFWRDYEKNTSIHK